jgi:hypothetical protein
MKERPLGKITTILADLGLEVTYAYDDLVFVQECAFLLQFMADPTELKLFINTECHPKVASEVAGNIVLKCDEAGFSVTPVGRYFLSPNEDETLKVEFAPAQGVER